VLLDRFIKNIGNQQSPKTSCRSSESVSSDAWSKRHSRSLRASKIKHSARGLPPSSGEMQPPALASAIYTNSARPMPTKNRHGNPRGNAKNADSIKGAHT